MRGRKSDTKREQTKRETDGEVGPQCQDDSKVEREINRLYGEKHL